MHGSFLDLNGQYKAIKHEIDPAVIAVLESGQYVLGPAVPELRGENSSALYGIKHAIACSSGTAALHPPSPLSASVVATMC